MEMFEKENLRVQKFKRTLMLSSRVDTETENKQEQGWIPRLIFEDYFEMGSNRG